MGTVNEKSQREYFSHVYLMINLQLTHQEVAVMTKIEAKNHFERVVQR